MSADMFGVSSSGRQMTETQHLTWQLAAVGQRADMQFATSFFGKCLGLHAADEVPKTESEQSEAGAQADTSEVPKGSKAQDKAAKDRKQDAKAKKREKSSETGKKNGKGRSKGQNRDMDDLRSKLPPDLQGKVFDMNDMKDLDMDSLKAKLEAMKLEKQGELTC